MRAVTLFLVVIPLVLLSETPLIAAPPTPTPEVAANGAYWVEQRIDYGQGGIIAMLVVVAGLQLVQIAISVANWLRGR